MIKKFFSIEGPIIDLIDKSAEVFSRPGVSTKTIKLECGSTITSHHHKCQDCSTENHNDRKFMVHDKLWNEIGLTGLICIKCFELRLGRELNPNDLTDCLYNKLLLKNLGV